LLSARFVQDECPANRHKSEFCSPRNDHTSDTEMGNFNHPAYKPYLGPSDLDLFGPLKEAMRGRRWFVNYDKVNEAVPYRLRTQPKICYLDARKKGCRSMGKMQWEAGRQHWEICNVRKINKRMWEEKGRKRFEDPSYCTLFIQSKHSVTMCLPHR
jgi:hypothetical protein